MISEPALIFPSLPGLQWGVVKTPLWSTKIHTSVSGLEFRAAAFSYPVWKFRLSYAFLRADSHHELQQLMGFFNQCQGAFRAFFYQDPSNRYAAEEAFGFTQSHQQHYQLIRAYGGFVEPVRAILTEPTVFLDGQAQVLGVDYTLSEKGVVSFIKPLKDHQRLTWRGSFYYRCRFMQDSTDFEAFMQDLWTAKKIELMSIKD